MGTDHQSQNSAARNTVVERIARQFAEDWKAGREPRIEAAWQSAGDSASEALLRQLILIELEARSDSEATISVVDYVERFRGLPVSEEAIRSTFEEWQGVVSTAGTQGDSRIIKAIQPSQPQQLDRYEIRDTLGKGSFGTVYRAWDPRLEREVALKVPHPHLLENPEVRERYLREARAVASLRHPGICPIHEVHELNDGTLLLSLAYIQGETLSDFICRERPIDEERAAKIIIRIAEAVERAHRKGVLHRDLKPQNILLPDGEDEPVVTDFGLARRTESDDATLTQDGMLLGTPAYMSPEQARGDVEKLGPASDIYSLGVILYEMLSGQRPFSGRTAQVLSQVLHDEPPSLSHFRPGVNPELESVCRRAMSKRPEDRFESMSGFCKTLELAQRQHPGTAPTVIAPAPVSPNSQTKAPRLKRLMGIAAAALLIVGGVWAIIAFRTDRNPPMRETADLNDLEGQSSTTVPPAIENQSPIVGRWRVFSTHLPAGGGLLEILGDGEAKLFLPQGTSRSAEFSEQSAELPEIESLTEADNVHLNWEEQPVDTSNTTFAGYGYDLGSMSQMTLTFEVESRSDRFPATAFNLHSSEEWSLAMTDNDHVFGSRTHASSELSEDLAITHDSITLIREEVADGMPLPPDHWLARKVPYFGMTTEHGWVAYLFLPDGQLFFAVDSEEPIGGRQGLGGIELTYRVTEFDGDTVHLEVRSNTSLQFGDLPPVWRQVRVASREEWFCTLQGDPQDSVWNRNVAIENHTHVIELRERQKLVTQQVDGEQVETLITETFGVEIPIVKTFLLTREPPESADSGSE